MKNIHELLKDQDIEIENKEEFDKAFNENYKTVAELEKKSKALKDLQAKYDEDIKSRDDKLGELQKQLADGGNDKETLEKAKKDLEGARTKFEAEKKEYEAKVEKEKYASAVEDAIKDLKFSSNSAKEQFTRTLIEKDLSIEDGKLLGLSDFVESYKKEDAQAFLEDGEGKPKFSTGSNNAGNTDGKDGEPVLKHDVPQLI